MYTCPEQTGDIFHAPLFRKFTEFRGVCNYSLDFRYFLAPIVIFFLTLYTNIVARFQMPFLGCVWKNSFIEYLNEGIVREISQGNRMWIPCALSVAGPGD